MRAKINRRLYILLAVIFSLTVILYVLSQLDWELVRSTLSNLRWGWLALAFLSYVINYYFRARRFQILLSLEKIPIVSLLSVVSIYGMYNYLLPAKSGEISLVVLLRNRLKVSLVNGATSLFVARYLDFVTVAIILPVVLIVNINRLPDWMVIVSGLFCVLIFLASVFFFLLFRDSIRLGFFFQPRSSLIDKLVKVLVEIKGAIIEIIRKQAHHRLLLNTFAIWACVYTNFYLVVVSLGYQTTYFQIIVVSIFMIPMTLLPIQGLANLGTHEIGWVAAFSIFNLPATDALSIAFSSHIVLLFFVLLLGFLGFLLGVLYKEKIND